nr:MAG: hypothetical protein 2 [Salisharnavirus sp.]
MFMWFSGFLKSLALDDAPGLIFFMCTTIIALAVKTVGENIIPHADEPVMVFWEGKWWWYDQSCDMAWEVDSHMPVKTQTDIKPQGKERRKLSRTNHVGSFVTNSGDREHIVHMDEQLYLDWVTWRHATVNIEPQAEEKTTSDEAHLFEMGGDSNQEENVRFVDTHPGYTMEEVSNFDPLRDHALQEDATLAQFFSRPVKIYEREWEVNGSAFLDVFNPWQLYFENPRVVNRISNYRLLRSKLHVKVVISGNAFHYGRLILSYNPLPNLDTLTKNRAGVIQDVVAASQRPHIYLDPTNSQGGELLLPFFYYKNLLDISASEWREMGELTLRELVPLKHANGATDKVTVSVFAWSCECKFAVPTQQEPTSIVPQADEYQRAPVSFVAGIVSSVSRTLAKVPLIAPFARATEIGADAVGAIATLFGYSRPVKIATYLHRPMTKQNIAVCNADDDAVKLTVDQKQELTVDPRTAGLDGIDEWDINFIAGRESYLTNFEWNVGTNSETLLWNSIVDPSLWAVHDSSEYHLPACAYAALPFKYWRGSMKFRFQVVCSKYHKGRLKLVYDPVKTAGDGVTTVAEYNTAYTTIIDIADVTDFTIECGWGQNTTYRQSIAIASTVQSGLYNNSPLGYDSSAVPWGNGTLAVYVVNELAVPNTTTNNDILVNVFVSMGDDFEVAVPEGERLQRMRLTSATTVQSGSFPTLDLDPQDTPINYEPPVMDPQGDSDDDSTVVEPQASENDNSGDEQDRKDSKPHTAPTVNRMSAQTNITDQANHVHFGEAIRSFRQLVKRYNRTEFVAFTFDRNPGEAVQNRAVRNLMPCDPGYTGNAGGSNLPKDLIGGKYFYGYMTFQRYATIAYGGWRGGMRWLLDASALNVLSEREVTMRASHLPTTEPLNDFGAVLFDLSTNLGKASLLEEDRPQYGHDGSMILNTTENSVMNYEVPYYQNIRFTPCKRPTNFAVGDIGMNQHSISYSSLTNSRADNIAMSVAGGEDFTVFMFLGAPVLYYEGSYPLA